MGRAYFVVNIKAVRPVADHIHLSSKLLKYISGNAGSRAVCKIKSDLFPLQVHSVSLCDTYDMLLICFYSVLIIIYGPYVLTHGIRELICISQKICFYLSYLVVAQL